MKYEEGKMYALDAEFNNNCHVLLCSFDDHFGTVRDINDGSEWKTMLTRLSTIAPVEKEVKCEHNFSRKFYYDNGSQTNYYLICRKCGEPELNQRLFTEAEMQSVDKAVLSGILQTNTSIDEKINMLIDYFKPKKYKS